MQDDVRREYKRPHCLAIIDLKKAFNSIEIEALMEALTQYIKILRELYKNFTTKISPFYIDINIDIKRGVRQGDTISSKLYTATLEYVMGTLGWDNRVVKIDGRQLEHLADDVVLTIANTRRAERMLADFDNACEKTGFRLNLTKTML
ncbi:unnamed protein product [Angiostrongylus costaricensis]|uniref:Reverse transcriptase domain-containing protein n=1 Tax=Angiostrongylus costaricensis TaxID=334426 RepID=A0A0R3PKI8_ANGCS|nr:unnamed protein product [Angiostrongylus costaricensis]